MNKIISIDVGGMLFKTSKQTLELSEYFKAILKYNKEDIIFIDRSPHIFKHVLSLLRDREYKYPSKYLSELEFYQIEYTDKETPNIVVDKLIYIINILDKFENILDNIETNTYI